MKKIIKVILTICMILVMTSCNKSEDGFKIDSLNKIDLSTYQFNENYKYYRSFSKQLLILLLLDTEFTHTTGIS